jgi:pimeloyl-ACP methyl ester carboxylesterase
MKETIATRELVVLDGLDIVLRGTYHKAPDDGSVAQIGQERVGLLFLNGLSATRAGNGDSAVYWADSFAEHGYPSFRLDLPGFGDSEGDPPADWLGFINQGGYAAIASAKIRELVARFNLSGVVMVGHCAGAVSAIYTAAASRECRGLVLMDPYFHLPQTIRPKILQQLNLWALQSRFGGLLSNIYGRLKEIRLLLRPDLPPENANFPLLRRWTELASTGLPILILKAPGWKTSGTKPRVGEFDYFKHVLELAGRRSQVVVKVVDGANHSFANRLGRAAVRQHTERWLNACFPLVKHEESAVSTSRSEPVRYKCHNEIQKNCLHG